MSRSRHLPESEGVAVGLAAYRDHHRLGFGVDHEDRYTTVVADLGTPPELELRGEIEALDEGHIGGGWTESPVDGEEEPVEDTILLVGDVEVGTEAHCRLRTSGGDQQSRRESPQHVGAGSSTLAQ